MNRLTTLAVGITTALSGVSYAAGFDDPTATVYYRLPFGGTSTRAESSYGFAVDYNLSVDAFGSPAQRRSLLDLRFQRNQLQDLRLNGVRFASRDMQTNELTIGGREIDNTTAAVVGGLLVAGVLCVTENVICEDDDTPAPVAPPPPAD